MLLHLLLSCILETFCLSVLSVDVGVKVFEVHVGINVFDVDVGINEFEGISSLSSSLRIVVLIQLL